MVLSKVEYEFFDFEEPSSHARELTRQLRLQFADRPMLFVSWTWERQHDAQDEPYSIAYAESSYFTAAAARIVDASDSPIWSRHIGRDVELGYLPVATPDLEHQVVELRSGTDRTYLSSCGVDRVRISNALPIEARLVTGG